MPTLPTVYLPHGGGPWPYIASLRQSDPSYDRLFAWLQHLTDGMAEAPRAVLVVSAHWEAPVPTLSSAERPGMLYDYSGFPDEAYRFVWAAPGSPRLAARARDLLVAAGQVAALDPQRGFDHATFVPAAITWPQANIPTVQLSLVRGLDPATHLAIGRALAPLRDEGVLILGSGLSYHNMRGLMGGSGGPASARFDGWLAESMALAPHAREARLLAWAQAPAARDCHPREEHLLPLMVCAGAAGADAATLPYRDSLYGAWISAVRFG